jgi:hypothetical protein
MSYKITLVWYYLGYYIWVLLNTKANAMTGQQLDDLMKGSIVGFNPHLESEVELPCDECGTETPEPELDDNRTEWGDRLCSSCYNSYANENDIES